MASKTDANTTEISVLKLDTQSISASVTDVQERVAESNESLSGQIEELSKEVNLKMSSEDVQLAISQTLNNGVDKVTTTTGFTFDADGLTVSKSDSEISTTITEDGMTISKSNDVVLVADNQGVRAEDLHATTYLMIGDNSRFEDRGDRTACFWVGG